MVCDPTIWIPPYQNKAGATAVSPPVTRGSGPAESRLQRAECRVQTDRHSALAHSSCSSPPVFTLYVPHFTDTITPCSRIGKKHCPQKMPIIVSPILLGFSQFQQSGREGFKDPIDTYSVLRQRHKLWLACKLIRVASTFHFSVASPPSPMSLFQRFDSLPNEKTPPPHAEKLQMDAT